MVRIRSQKVVNVFLPVVLLLFAARALAGQKLPQDEMLKRIRAIVADLESRLQMSQHIEVSIVPAEPRMLSVQRVPGASGDSEVFLITLDHACLEDMNQEELTAALAHELGHVWIFCHHPYLQTEALANEIAMKAISREGLKTLYGKLWLHLGTSGDLGKVLGEEARPAGPVASSAAHQD